MKRIFFLFVMASIGISACQNKATTSAGNEFQKELQEKLKEAKEGDVIELPEGTYELNRTLLLDSIPNITIKGKGKDKTILNFKDQSEGAEGLHIKADGIVLEDFAILDTKGDGIQVQNAINVTFRRVKVGWTTLHNSDNGSHGTSTVGCTNVMIEECEVLGSAKAGIFVSQSKNIVVRKCHAHDNTAGIVIENSTDADVYENLLENNSGGLFVFDLPGLRKKNASRCRLFNNHIINNNTPHFGKRGTILSEIPVGTGFVLLAANQCEVFNNDISGHNSLSGAILSYRAFAKSFDDSIYDPYCGGISVHDNKFTHGSGQADSTIGFAHLLSSIFRDKIPDLIVDGYENPAYKNPNGQTKESQRICIVNNANITFANLDMPNQSKYLSKDLSKYNCTLPQVNAVKLNL